MNDPGLDEPIQDVTNNVTHALKEKAVRSNGPNDEHGPKAAIRHELEADEEEEEVGYFQPTSVQLSLFSIRSIRSTLMITDGGGSLQPRSLS